MLLLLEVRVNRLSPAYLLEFPWSSLVLVDKLEIFLVDQGFGVALIASWALQSSLFPLFLPLLLLPSLLSPCGLCLLLEDLVVGGNEVVLINRI